MNFEEKVPKSYDPHLLFAVDLAKFKNKMAGRTRRQHYSDEIVAHAMRLHSLGFSWTDLGGETGSGWGLRTRVHQILENYHTAPLNLCIKELQSDITKYKKIENQKTVWPLELRNKFAAIVTAHEIPYQELVDKVNAGLDEKYHINSGSVCHWLPAYQIMEAVKGVTKIAPMKSPEKIVSQTVVDGFGAGKTQATIATKRISVDALGSAEIKAGDSWVPASVVKAIRPDLTTVKETTEVRVQGHVITAKLYLDIKGL